MLAKWNFDVNVTFWHISVRWIEHNQTKDPEGLEISTSYHIVLSWKVLKAFWHKHFIFDLIWHITVRWIEHNQTMDPEGLKISTSYHMVLSWKVLKAFWRLTKRYCWPNLSKNVHLFNTAQTFLDEGTTLKRILYFWRWKEKLEPLHYK